MLCSLLETRLLAIFFHVWFAKLEPNYPIKNKLEIETSALSYNNNNSQIVHAYAGCGVISMYTILPLGVKYS